MTLRCLSTVSRHEIGTSTYHASVGALHFQHTVKLREGSLIALLYVSS